MPKGHKTFVRYNGRRVCLAEAARMAGMPKDRLMSRLKSGWSFNKAIKHPMPFSVSNAIPVTIDGVTKHISAWCRELGINNTTICARVKKGMTYKQALTLKNKCSPEATRRERRWQVLSLLLGGCAQLIKRRVSCGWDVREAESTPVKHEYSRRSKKVFNAKRELLKLGVIV